jgi:hypothetical protein
MVALANPSDPSPREDQSTTRSSRIRLFARLLALLAPLLLVSCKGGSGSSDPSSPPVATIQVSPANVQVAADQTTQFTATVDGASSSGVVWEVDGIRGGNATYGTIAAGGLYTAPASIPSPSTIPVTAVLETDQGVSGSASVTITLPPTLTPQRAALTTSQTVQFQATGPYMSNSTVNWGVDGVPGGKPSSGTIDSNGLYTPGAAGKHIVQATSKTDGTLTASATVYVTDFAGNFSWRNDLSISGVNSQELALSPSTLAAGGFGKLFSCKVDGQVYAQPLYVANLSIPGSGMHNVIFVATEHDSVYAFDADAIPCQNLWEAPLLNEVSGATTVPSSNNITPEIGITGTPVIDPSTRTLYVVAETREGAPGAYTYVHRLHALDLFTGQEKFGGPVVITASVAGTGDGNDGRGNVAFDALVENQRAALQLFGGQVYMAFASNGDQGAYHGWLLAYDAATLAQTAVFNTTPDGSAGGIWQSGAALSVDAASGNVFLGVGNGTFDADSSTAPNTDYGETLLQLSVSPGAFSILGSFTPYDQAILTTADNDFASTGVLLLPDAAGSSLQPHLALIGGKAGYLYLVDRDHLGGYTSGGPDNVVQKVNLNGALFGTPAYWNGTNNGTIYVAPSGQPLEAFAMTNGILASSPSSQSAQTFAFPPPSPVISSDGTHNGVVWVLDNSGYAAGQPTVLHAYDATNLSNELYNSTQKKGDAAGPAVKFTVPTVANGKVYVGTQNEITVYGLLPGP